MILLTLTAYNSTMAPPNINIQACVRRDRAWQIARSRLTYTPRLGQESLANAKVNARQHCVSLSCLCNSWTQIEWVVQLLLPPKHAKSREIPREFDLTAVQGHPRSSILVSIESPYVTSY